MTLEGKVYKVLPLESGEGKNGTWNKKTVVIETADGKYPKKVAIALWGDLATDTTLNEGGSLSVEVNIESKESAQGKWYTELKAWKVNN